MKEKGFYTFCLYFFCCLLSFAGGLQSVTIEDHFSKQHEFQVLFYNKGMMNKIKRDKSKPSKNDLSKYIGYIIVHNSENYISRGSGIFVNYEKNTFFLTNKHVCENATNPNSYFVMKGSVNGIMAKVSVMKLDKFHDLCIIPLDESLGVDWIKSYPLNLKDIKLVKNTTYCALTHNSSNVKSSVYYSNCGKLKSREDVDMPTVPGDSGSPLFNNKKELAGLVFMREIGFDTNSTKIIPKSEIVRFAQSIYPSKIVSK